MNRREQERKTALGREIEKIHYTGRGDRVKTSRTGAGVLGPYGRGMRGIAHAGMASGFLWKVETV
jgi:hypothetical protein